MATKRMKSPLMGQLELTTACNFACLHCYNYWRYLENGRTFFADNNSLDLNHFIELLNVFIDNEIPVITFTGGEPFIRRDILFPLVVKANEAGIIVKINTNATLITATDIEMLEKMKIRNILVSFPSCDENEYATITNSNQFSNAINVIRMLVDSTLNVQINMVVSNVNKNSVLKTGLFLKDIGIKNFSATPAVSCPNAHTHKVLLLSDHEVKKVLDDLLELQAVGMDVDVLEPIVHCMFEGAEKEKYKQFWDYHKCTAGISDVAISPTGDVRACILASSTEGNIFVDGWDKCWSNLSGWATAAMLPNECNECAVVDDCSGGCRVAALAVNGSISGNDPYMKSKLTDVPLGNCSDSAIVLNNYDTLSFNEDLTFRSEPFGGTLICNDKCLFLKEGAFAFVKKIFSRGEAFTIAHLIQEYAVDADEVHAFIKALLKSEFLIRSE